MDLQAKAFELKTLLLEFYYQKICEEEVQDRNRALTQDERNEIREEIKWHMTQIRKE